MKLNLNTVLADHASAQRNTLIQYFKAGTITALGSALIVGAATLISQNSSDIANGHGYMLPETPVMTIQPKAPSSPVITGNTLYL